MFVFGTAHVRVVALALGVVACVLFALIALDADRRAQFDAATAAPATAAPTVQTEASTVDEAPAASADSSSGQLASLSRDTAVPAATATRVRGTLSMNITRDTVIRKLPGAGSVIGTMPARSAYLQTPMRAWIMEVSPDGRFGKVVVPWARTQQTGWIRLRGATRSSSTVVVRASLSRRQIVVERDGTEVLRISTTIGAASSPSPTGAFFVTDLVPVPRSQPQFGSYAFGLSGIQPNLPAGWTGGNQMAIHGTNSPRSIGAAASAGCLRVSETSLRRLRGLLEPGTPVLISR